MCGGGVKNWTQGLVYTSHVLYHWSIAPYLEAFFMQSFQCCWGVWFSFLASVPYFVSFKTITTKACTMGSAPVASPHGGISGCVIRASGSAQGEVYSSQRYESLDSGGCCGPVSVEWVDCIGCDWRWVTVHLHGLTVNIWLLNVSSDLRTKVAQAFKTLERSYS